MESNKEVQPDPTLADKRITEARVRIEKQRKILAQKRANGDTGAEARDLLHAMEIALETMLVQRNLAMVKDSRSGPISP